MKRPRVDRRVDCPACQGTGYTDGFNGRHCRHCDGEGKVSKYGAKEIEQRLKR